MIFHGNITIKIDSDFLNKKLSKAQSDLVNQVIADCIDYTPFKNGDLSTGYEVQNDDEIVWCKPYAHYQYMGKSKFTGKPLNYSKEGHPKATSEWFEKAKDDHLNDWIDTVKRTLSDRR